MARRLTASQSKIAIEEAQLRATLANMPDNPIPWASLLRIVAPIVTRLAVRYTLKKVKRGMADDKVKAVSDTITELIDSMLSPSS